MTLDNSLERAGSAIEFLQKLGTDTDLAQKCQATDLEGRLALATEMGYVFDEPDLRLAIKNWDYHGTWGQWLSAGRFAEGVDDLPALNEAYHLTNDQISSYQRDGHLLLKSVLSSEEVAAYRPVIRDAVDRFNPEKQALHDRDFKAFLLVVNLRARAAAARRLVLSQRFAKIAAELMGVPSVRIYLDEAFYKEPGGALTPWHQDRLYFPLDTDNVVTLWMPIVDLTAEMGTLRFASGSHMEGDLGYQPISDEAEAHFQKFLDERGYRLAPNVAMSAGDATLHHGWVLHSAPPNSSGRAREVMSVVYYPDGTKLVEPNNIYQERAMLHGFGKTSGELAESPLHPIAYSRGP